MLRLGENIASPECGLNVAPQTDFVVRMQGLHPYRDPLLSGGRAPPLKPTSVDSLPLEFQQDHAPFSIQDVALYFLQKEQEKAEQDLTPLKLQKMCYFAQGCRMAARKEMLFPNSFQSWQHGPVDPVLYQKYKRFGKNIINLSQHDVEKKTEVSKNQEVKSFLDTIYDEFGRYSAGVLVNKAHDKAWRMTWQRASGQNDFMPNHLIYDSCLKYVNVIERCLSVTNSDEEEEVDQRPRKKRRLSAEKPASSATNLLNNATQTGE